MLFQLACVALCYCELCVCYRSEKEAKFCALEKLIADDNRFTSDDIFIALAGLPW